MAANTFSSLKDHFLLAMPGLQDPRFAHAVVYICEHSEDGAMGLTINHPIDIPVSQVFDEMGLDGYPEGLGKQPLLAGGPVQTEKGFVLHNAGTQWESTIEISPTVSLTSSKDILEDMANNKGPAQCFITLGYAGWGPGQLEQEIADNAWLTLPADPAIIFDVPFAQRASATASRLGISLDRLSIQAGHA